jgi:hypothetical protein
MTLGKAPAQSDLFGSGADFCEDRLGPSSVYRLLHSECHRLFPDELFADLFEDIGRRSVPPRIVAVVMVLQRLEGLSDRDAADRFAFDLRWKYAAGGLEFNFPGFVHTVLVDMRARLRASERPNRIFDAVLDVAKQAGLVGRKRVLDSTALYDAVATQDTVTLIRSAIRALLKVADGGLALQLRAALKRDDDYQAPGKPACDWDDEAAREAVIDALARDAHALLALLDGLELVGPLREAATLLSTVTGQDLEQREDGAFRIARRVAPDRVISTVDPEARHGHKTSARGFDGYKGHIAIDPDSEIITATAVTAGNVADGRAAEHILSDVLPSEATDIRKSNVEVFGDASYGTGELVDRLEEAGIEANVKVQGAVAREGLYSQDDFHIDTKAGTARCPQGVLVQLRRSKDGFASAEFRAHCAACPQRERCTSAKSGRSLWVHARHDTLVRSRTRQKNPAWLKRYRATRPKVERKLAHLMRHRHGGRRARVRGTVRIGHDFALLGAAMNLRRLATFWATSAH